MKENIFSVIIPAYGGGELWKAAVDSVLMQDYPVIELIFADDCTPGFDVEPVRAYIQAHRHENLVRFEVVRREKNMGTVRNLRAAHMLCTGRYLTHIAMDDVYCDETVLSRYAAALDEKPQDVLGVYARSLVCDESLKPVGYASFDTEVAQQMNTMTAKEQFGHIARRCCIHMGATAFIREEFMAYGDFDTDYRLIEDWPFFLAATRRDMRFLYLPFDAIFYRNGGVTDKKFSSQTKRVCCMDHIRLYERLILPNLDMLTRDVQTDVYAKYVLDRKDMSYIYGRLSEMDRWERTKKYGRYLPLEVWVTIRRKWKRTLLWLTYMCVLVFLGRGLKSCLFWTVLILSINTALEYIKKQYMKMRLIKEEI